MYLSAGNDYQGEGDCYIVSGLWVYSVGDSERQMFTVRCPTHGSGASGGGISVGVSFVE